MFNHSSLDIIPRPKRTSRLTQRLVSGNIDHGDNLDTSNSTDIESDNTSNSSSYQSSNCSSSDEIVHSMLKPKLFPCKIILFPNHFPPEDHSQFSSISIGKFKMQPHKRSTIPFPLLFPNINPNIITLEAVTTHDKYHNEDILLTICRPRSCHVNLSPISSPLTFPRNNTDTFHNAAN